MLAAAVVLAACAGSHSRGSTASPAASHSPSPSPQPTPSPSPAFFDYRVHRGDTVTGIAARFGTSGAGILQTNGLPDGAVLNVGQVLRIIGATNPPPPDPAGTGFIFPIAGACLPSADDLMPNAPRPYRFGVHEGVDFASGETCSTAPAGTPVLDVKAGQVIRVDRYYEDLTPAEVDALENRAQQQGFTDSVALDLFRGRQVWIDHGSGVVSRYCHLGGVPDGLEVGQPVQQGQVIGFVGDSGTPEAAASPGSNIHLHFELRVGDSYLGAALSPDQVRYLYEEVFGVPGTAAASPTP